MLLLSPRGGCTDGPVAWCSRIKRTVLGRNHWLFFFYDRKVLRSRVCLLLFNQVDNNRLVQSGGIFPHELLRAVQIQNPTSRRVLLRLLCSSPLGCTLQSALTRCSERRTATCGCRESCCRCCCCCCALSAPASPNKSPPPSARFYAPPAHGSTRSLCPFIGLLLSDLMNSAAYLHLRAESHNESQDRPGNVRPDPRPWRFDSDNIERVCIARSISLDLFADSDEGFRHPARAYRGDDVSKCHDGG